MFCWRRGQILRPPMNRGTQDDGLERRRERHIANPRGVGYHVTGRAWGQRPPTIADTTPYEASHVPGD